VRYAHIYHERMAKIPVYLEVGAKRVFAASFDWPGWGRFDKGFGKGTGRDAKAGGGAEEAALEALAAYAERYAVVAREAGLKLPAKLEFEVVERLPGSGTTDFGAPGAVAARDTEPVGRREAEKMAALLTASWRLFDRVAAKAPAELRKGPRGGGRDRDKMVWHVVESEFGYGRVIGIKHRVPEPGDAAAVAAMREEVAAVLGRPSDGGPLAGKKWPARYAARRFAWHVLDHLWEMEDRSE
jgi:hypothetical protein